MKIRNQFILILALLFAFSLVAKAQTQNISNDNQPKVIKAVAPKEYPSSAYITNVQGKVVIEVEINSEGFVESVKWLKGHKLFKEVSENAAKKWRFNSIEGKAKRVVQINFVYELVFEEGENSEIAFNAPYEIEIKYKFSNVINPK